jgi:hypothetical protein
MPRASLSLAMIAVAFTAASTEVRAEGQEPVSIRVDGSIPCTSEADFFARVHRRAPGARSGQPGEPTRSFTIILEGAAPSMRGRLSIVRLDGRSSTREVTGESCTDVVDALALITAVDIDPDAARATPSERIAVETFPSTPDEREPPPPTLVAPAPSEPWHVSAGIEPSVTAGVAPQPLFGLPVFLELMSPSSGILSPSFALGFERTFNSTTEIPAGDAVFDLVGGFFQACPVAYSSSRLRAGPCLRFDAGLLQAAGKKGKSLNSAQTDSGPWFALGLVGRANYQLGGPVFVGAQFGLGIPLVPYQYRFDPDTLLGQTGRLHWRAGMGMAVRFL